VNFKLNRHSLKIVYICYKFTHIFFYFRKSGFNDGNLVLGKGGESLVLEKFTVSNALALSVKLGSWEAALEKYIDSIEYVTEVS